MISMMHWHAISKVAIFVFRFDLGKLECGVMYIENSKIAQIGNLSEIIRI